MGDVDEAWRAAERRRTGGMVMLATAVVVGLVVGLAINVGHRSPFALAVQDLIGSPAAGAWLCVAFAAGSLPLLVPQREPPESLRHNRWYIAVMMFATLFQGVIMTY